MGDKTGISWTDATWTCSTCGVEKLLSEFCRDASWPHGHAYVCNECRNARQREKYVRKPARSRCGILLAPTRDGDKRQARARVNHLVEIGAIPRPEDLGCIDCGDMQGFASARHEYDHAKGYDGANQFYVEPVCAHCHRVREEARCG